MKSMRERPSPESIKNITDNCFERDLTSQNLKHCKVRGLDKLKKKNMGDNKLNQV